MNKIREDPIPMQSIDKDVINTQIQTLLKNATSDNATNIDRLALLFWFWRYGNPVNQIGDGYRIDSQRSIHPVVCRFRDFKGNVITTLYVDAIIK